MVVILLVMWCEFGSAVLTRWSALTVHILPPWLTVMSHKELGWSISMLHLNVKGKRSVYLCCIFCYVSNSGQKPYHDMIFNGLDKNMSRCNMLDLFKSHSWSVWCLKSYNLTITPTPTYSVSLDLSHKYEHQNNVWLHVAHLTFRCMSLIVPIIYCVYKQTFACYTF